MPIRWVVRVHSAKGENSCWQKAEWACQNIMNLHQRYSGHEFSFHFSFISLESAAGNLVTEAPLLVICHKCLGWQLHSYAQQWAGKIWLHAARCHEREIFAHRQPGTSMHKPSNTLPCGYPLHPATTSSPCKHHAFHCSLANKLYAFNAAAVAFEIYDTIIDQCGHLQHPFISFGEMHLALLPLHCRKRQPGLVLRRLGGPRWRGSSSRPSPALSLPFLLSHHLPPPPALTHRSHTASSQCIAP